MPAVLGALHRLRRRDTLTRPRRASWSSPCWRATPPANAGAGRPARAVCRRCGGRRRPHDRARRTCVNWRPRALASAARRGASAADDVAEPETDLGRARAALEPQLRPPGQVLDALSFPRGRHDAASLAAARQRVHHIAHQRSVLERGTIRAARGGRISIDAAAIGDEGGAFAPSRLATWLLHRPVEALAV